MASIRKHENKTGGGPCTSIELTNDDNRIIAIIGKENLDGNLLHEAGFSLPAKGSSGKIASGPSTATPSQAGPSQAGTRQTWTSKAAGTSQAGTSQAGTSTSRYASESSSIPETFIIDDVTEVKDPIASSVTTDALAGQNVPIVVAVSSDSESSENSNQNVTVKRTVITTKHFI